MKLKKNKGELLIEILSNLLYGNKESPRMDLALIFGEVFTDFPTITDSEGKPLKRKILQHLDRKTWLKEICNGKDLLDRKTHVEYFNDKVLEERDLEELRAFNNFGDETAYVNGKEVGIFEFRLRPNLIFTGTEIERYMLNMSEYITDLNSD